MLLPTLCFSSKTGQGKKPWKPQHCLWVTLLLCELGACVVRPALTCRMWAALCSPFCFCSVCSWHWLTLHPGNTSDCWNGKLHSSTGFLQTRRDIQTNKLPKTASAEFRTDSSGLFPVDFGNLWGQKFQFYLQPGSILNYLHTDFFSLYSVRPQRSWRFDIVKVYGSSIPVNVGNVFLQVIHKHFYLKRVEIMAQCEEWIADIQQYSSDKRVGRTMSHHAAALKVRPL